MYPTRKKLLLPFVVLILAVITIQCATNKSIVGKNISFVYRPEINGLRFDFRAIQSGDRSVIHLRLPTSSLLASADEQGIKTVSYTLNYKLYTNYSTPETIDSGQIIRKEVRFTPGGFQLDSLVFRGLENRGYVVEATMRDVNAQSSYTAFIDLVRSASFHAQNVVFVSDQKGMLYTNIVDQFDSLRVYHQDNEPLFAKYYNRDFPLASPPFSVITPNPFDFTPDSIIRMERHPEGYHKLYIEKLGLYQVCKDVQSKNGPTLYSFGPYFPVPKTVMDLALPLRYITTNEEYTAILNAENTKKEVDAFWLEVAGNQQRARELIRGYYERVQYANTYFTSYLEGWKTDRGMCYIVYGPPDVVNRSSATETWSYGDDGRYATLSLTFTKVVNPFTANDYRLNRSVALKNSWYQAVEYWRQGRVIIFK